MIQGIHEIAALPHVSLERRDTLPVDSGIYFVMHGEKLLYIGKTNNFLHRWGGHHRLKNLKGLDGVKIHWLSISDIASLLEIEADLISAYTPPLNGYRTPSPVHIPPFRRLPKQVQPSRLKDPKTAVKTVLAERGVNLTQFAQQLGIPQQSLSRTPNTPIVNQRSHWPAILEALNLKIGAEVEKEKR